MAEIWWGPGVSEDSSMCLLEVGSAGAAAGRGAHTHASHAWMPRLLTHLHAWLSGNWYRCLVCTGLIHMNRTLLCDAFRFLGGRLLLVCADITAALNDLHRLHDS